jgi:lipoprotein-releasing system permease protein
MRWLLLLARKYFTSKRKSRGLTPFILQTIGIALGVATLITVLSVMNGFQLGFINTILELRSFHVLYENPEEPEKLEIIESLSEMNQVKSIYEFKEFQSMVRSRFLRYFPVFVRAVQPDIYKFDEGFQQNLTMIDGDFADLDSGEAIIGSTLASLLRVDVGDTFTMPSPASEALIEIEQNAVSFEVAAIFETSFPEYNSGMVFISLDDPVLETTASKTGIKLYNRFGDQAFARKLSRDYPQLKGIKLWRDFNSAFFQALRLEKTSMFLVMALMFLVVSFNIYQSVQRNIRERKEDIAILRSMGAGQRPLRFIFILETFFIGFFASSIGTVLGIMIVENLNNITNFFISFLYNLTPGSQLRGGLFLQNLPTQVLSEDILFITLIALITCTLAGIFASKRILKIYPVEVLRDE